MRNIKLDPPEKHDYYVKSMKANKFDLIALPESLPPLVAKPQVNKKNKYILISLFSKRFAT